MDRPSQIEEIIERVEIGRTDQDDAIVLRQYIALLELSNVRASNPGRAQAIAYSNVCERGYDKRLDGTPWTPDELAARQVLKAICELRELCDHVRLLDGGTTGRLLWGMRMAAELARDLFRYEPGCVGAHVAGWPAAMIECYDVVIPMLVFAQVGGGDVEAGVIVKSRDDVKRGKG